MVFTLSWRVSFWFQHVHWSMEKVIHGQNKEVRWGMGQPPWSWQSLTKGGSFSYLCVWGNGTSPLHLPTHAADQPAPRRQVDQVEKWLRRAEDQSLKLSLVSFPDAKFWNPMGPQGAKCWTRNQKHKVFETKRKPWRYVVLKWRLYLKNTKVEWCDLWIRGHRSMLMFDHSVPRLWMFGGILEPDLVVLEDGLIKFEHRL